MAQAKTCRMVCAIVIDRKTLEKTTEWADVPAAAADAWGQRMARAWETAQDMMRQAGEDPEDERRDEHVQV